MARLFNFLVFYIRLNEVIYLLLNINLLLARSPNNYPPNVMFPSTLDTNWPVAVLLCNQKTRAQFGDIANKIESWPNSVLSMHSVSFYFGSYLFLAANDPRFVDQRHWGHLEKTHFFFNIGKRHRPILKNICIK